MKRSHAPVLTFLLLTACPGSAFAHAVGVSCALRDDKVEVEAYYDDDSPAANARVHVLNAAEQMVASGITDEKGRWHFVKPKPGTYTVRLDAGAGHRAKATLTVPRIATEPKTTHPTSTEVTSERDQFTQIPWLNVLIGLAVIGGGCGVFLIVARLRSAARGRSPEAKI